MNLWQIDNSIQEIIANGVDEETGEISEAASEALNALQMARDTKIENVALGIKNLLAEAAAVKAEKISLAKRQSSLEKKAEWLKEYLSRFLNGETVKGARFEIAYRKSVACEMDDAAVLQWCSETDHANCVKVETTVRLDEIKKLLKEGVDVAGAQLVERQNIQIK